MRRQEILEMRVVQNDVVKAAGLPGQLAIYADLGRQVDDAAADFTESRRLDCGVDIGGVAGGEAAHDDYDLPGGVGRHVAEGGHHQLEGVL